MIDVTRPPRVRSGYWQAVIVFVAAALVNAPKWREFRYIEIPAGDNASAVIAAAADGGQFAGDADASGKIFHSSEIRDYFS